MLSTRLTALAEIYKIVILLLHRSALQSQLNSSMFVFLSDLVKTNQASAIFVISMLNFDEFVSEYFRRSYQIL